MRTQTEGGGVFGRQEELTGHSGGIADGQDFLRLSRVLLFFFFKPSSALLFAHPSVFDDSRVSTSEKKAEEIERRRRVPNANLFSICLWLVRAHRESRPPLGGRRGGGARAHEREGRGK